MAPLPQVEVVTGHVRCRRCQKFRNPAEFVGGPYGYCLMCYEKHRRMHRMLCGDLPVACQECHVTIAELSARSANPDIPMEVHVKDGLYQILCPPCGLAYAKQRRDLYGNTPFAAANHLD